jgi:hypothetical protein
MYIMLTSKLQPTKLLINLDNVVIFWDGISPEKIMETLTMEDIVGMASYISRLNKQSKMQSICSQILL